MKKYFPVIFLTLMIAIQAHSSAENESNREVLPLSSFASPPLLAGRKWNLGIEKNQYFFQRKELEKLTIEKLNALCPKDFRVVYKKDFVEKLNLSDLDAAFQGEMFYEKTSGNSFSRFQYCHLEQANKNKLIFKNAKNHDLKSVPEQQRDTCQLLCVNITKDKK